MFRHYGDPSEASTPLGVCCKGTKCKGCMARVFAGYMCCPFVLDKDGVSAAVICAELASFLATKNLSLSQQLKAIYVE